MKKILCTGIAILMTLTSHAIILNHNKIFFRVENKSKIPIEAKRMTMTMLDGGYESIRIINPNTPEEHLTDINAPVTGFLASDLLLKPYNSLQYPLYVSVGKQLLGGTYVDFDLKLGPTYWTEQGDENEAFATCEPLRLKAHMTKLNDDNVVKIVFYNY